MTPREVAEAFTAALKEGRGEETRFWSEDVVSLEAMEGPMARCEGRAAVEAKSAWWMANHEVHSFTVEGPFLHGDQFGLRFGLDFTRKEDGARMTMAEIGLYTVAGGAIIEERFFY
ncbi:nuclear transport factor 2 family protein [Roseococcus microcysteis]|uniref:nuclear transport factor 2 family protein n=1 Tax=Roseococcus microcysteis TaxID=2771361 RepID=UPI00168C029F|nr:nuclear transport factor 2 family protein [Roseococcus microcysteis]